MCCVILETASRKNRRYLKRALTVFKTFSLLFPNDADRDKEDFFLEAALFKRSDDVLPAVDWSCCW